MLKYRLIAVIIVRDGRVVQSINFKHTNVIHYDAFHAVEAFNRWSIDEMILINVSKDESSQSQFLSIVNHVSKTCFVPLTVGGWVNTEEYSRALISSGADKLLLNSAFFNQQELIEILVQRFGRQCIVASIDSKRVNGQDVVCVNRGQDTIGIDPVHWSQEVEKIGAGEIFFNSIDHDGARKGYALDLISGICKAVSIPVIAFGGVFRWKHLTEGINAGANAVAAANIFHYTEHSTKRAKRFMAQHGIPVRSEGT